MGQSVAAKCVADGLAIGVALTVCISIARYVLGS